MRQKLARAAIVMSLGIATLVYGSIEKHVTVRIEGRPVGMKTFAGTVGDALVRANIPLGPQDRIEPPVPTRIRDGSVIDVYRAKTVNLMVNGRPRQVIVTGQTIDEVLAEISLRTTLADTIHPSRASRVRPGMTIVYRRAVSLSVIHDGGTQRVLTNAETVGAVVTELGIKLGPRDRIQPAPATPPAAGMKIRVLRVGIRQEVVEQAIAFKTVLRRDHKLEYGVRKPVQEGRSGLRVVRYESKYVDGKRVARKVLSERVVRKPVDRVIAIGAGYPGCACTRGVETGKATWYREADGLSAAHKTLPKGTVVRVENLANGKWINVVIRDRGPYVPGRIIDLSDESFRRLAPLGTGVIKVRIRW